MWKELKASYLIQPKWREQIEGSGVWKIGKRVKKARWIVSVAGQITPNPKEGMRGHKGY